MFSPNRRFIKILIIFAVLGIGGIIATIFFGDSNSPEEEKIVTSDHHVIGKSVEGRQIESYTYGNGDKHILFVGGMHGGYEWNSVLLAYNFIDYLENNLNTIPKNIKVSVIPSLNPDGVYDVTLKEGRFNLVDVKADTENGLGRFNANGVDLNRNFDCKWQKESFWRGKVVSAGSKPFSEPESQALRDFVLEYKPVAVIFWHSQSNAVYASECEDGILLGTLNLMNEYSRSTGYEAIESFDAYPITGDAEGWLSSIGIPAITVELKSHETIEWQKNLAGISALFKYYSKRL